MHLPTVAWGFVFVLHFVSAPLSRADEATNEMRLTAPQSYQVVQRNGFNVRQSHAHAVGGPQRGAADVAINGSLSTRLDGRIECRTLLLDDAFGSAVPWTDYQGQDE